MGDRIGLILTGGGARAAYQVGVLQAIAECLPHHAPTPFSVICGTSAGALNAATLAANAHNFKRSVRYLSRIWLNFHTYQVYRTDAAGVFVNTAKWLAGLVLGGMGVERFREVALLDNKPLANLLDQILPFENIQKHIDEGKLHALSITASGYESGESVTFYQGADSIVPWRRTRRVGVPTEIDARHLLASAAIPFIFPAQRINREYFGDGSVRQIAPVSAALHLGAARVLVIGATNDAVESSRRVEEGHYPTLAQIAGHALNSIFLDSMEIDIERVMTVNHLVEAMTVDTRRATGLVHVDLLVIKPSEAIDKIAQRHMADLPWTIRLLLRLIGASPRSGGATLVSYLLSEKKYCRALVDLGYRDALKQRAEILRFLDIPADRSGCKT